MWSMTMLFCLVASAFSIFQDGNPSDKALRMQQVIREFRQNVGRTADSLAIPRGRRVVHVSEACTHEDQGCCVADMIMDISNIGVAVVFPTRVNVRSCVAGCFEGAIDLEHCVMTESSPVKVISIGEAGSVDIIHPSVQGTACTCVF